MSKCLPAKKCGACAYINDSYETSLKAKQKEVSALLGRFGHVDDIIPADDPFNYRNKVHAAYSMEKGRIIYGTYEEGSHRIVQNEGCLIEDKRSSGILKTIADLIRSFKLLIYDERTGRGFYRRTLIRFSSLGEVMVVLVTASNVFPGKKDFVRALLNAHPYITTVIINVNNRRDSMILGSKSATAYGKGYIVDKVLGKTFKISPSAFFQINHAQTEKLYSKAIELCNLKGSEKVLDAYCGTGSIGICLASTVDRVTGVELNREAVACAIENARHNGLKNTDFVCDDCTSYMIKNRDKADFDLVVLDPPRAGTTTEFIDAVTGLDPLKICYISCDPNTLQRDLALFARKGYECKKICPLDMMPFTGHVEVVSLLQRMSSTRERTITLDVEMEDYHRIKNGTEVTADAKE